MSTLLRPDLQIIADLIPAGVKLLDVGCGEGELLAWLAKHKQVDGRGIELSQPNVAECVAHGLSVIQGDADNDLAYYPDHGFDYIILSKALQMMRDPVEVLDQIRRISKRSIVSIPNFGHWKNRLYLGLKGRMPVTSTLSYQWYDTPNIHFSTIRDFIVLCKERNIPIISRLAITDDGKAKPFTHDRFVNLMNEQAVFVLGE